LVQEGKCATADTKNVDAGPTLMDLSRGDYRTRHERKLLKKPKKKRFMTKGTTFGHKIGVLGKKQIEPDDRLHERRLDKLLLEH